MTDLNHLKRATGAVIFSLGLAFAPSAVGQQHGGMSATDMQTMMNQCAQMRQHMQQNPGMAHTAEMQRMMAQCDQMDRMHGSQPGTAPAQRVPSQQR